jgi:hypothetical protein
VFISAGDPAPPPGALLEELGAETDEEAAQLEIARERGYYVGVMPVPALVATVPGRGHHPEAVAGILRQLSRPAPKSRSRPRLPRRVRRGCDRARDAGDRRGTRRRNLRRMAAR